MLKENTGTIQIKYKSAIYIGNMKNITVSLFITDQPSWHRNLVSVEN